MKKFICLLFCLFIGSANATIINNGSFETGNFNSWTTQDITPQFFPLSVGASGVNPGFGLFSASPTDGNFAALNGFDGGGPGVISLSQNITVTSLSTVVFDYRAGWDMQSFVGSTLNRSFDVNISSLSGSNLASFNILTAAAGTQNVDTGNLLGSVDLSSFIGQTVNISFDWTIPEPFTGPAFFQLDNITSTSATVASPASVALLGLGLAGLMFSRKRKTSN